MHARILPLSLLVAGTIAVSGCTPALIITGVGTTAAVVSQERSAGDAIDDATVQINVKARLLEQDPGLFRRTDIEVVEQRVLLVGVVPTEEAKARAGQITRDSKGVKSVINELQVSPLARWPSYPNDVWITSQLRTQLVSDPEVRQINYHIETVAGTVYLFGIGRSKPELDLVASHASQIRGVIRVVSHVMLADDPARAG